MSPHWQPRASIAVLRRRARLLADIRAYFARTGALEVDTPLLAPTGATDPALESLTVGSSGAPLRYLQTSPEFAMKRLLAAGSGDIFQICHAFRREEDSPLHQEEFTLLEWYRVGHDHHRLMDDMSGLLAAVGWCFPLRRASYRALCLELAGIDPITASDEQLLACARGHGARFETRPVPRGLLLDWLLGCRVLPALPADEGIFVHGFPSEQAAYARLSAETPPVAERFELVLGTMELANGFHEVLDAGEQRRRQEAENARRLAQGLPRVPLDEPLLGALAAGLPPCAGVALGLDRLLMALAGLPDIRDTLAFPAAQRE